MKPSFFFADLQLPDYYPNAIHDMCTEHHKADNNRHV